MDTWYSHKKVSFPLPSNWFHSHEYALYFVNQASGAETTFWNNSGMIFCFSIPFLHADSSLQWWTFQNHHFALSPCAPPQLSVEELNKI